MARNDDLVERRKRFYAKADFGPAEGGFAVRLDGRIPRSPEGRPLILPTAALAEFVAAEWEAQGETIAMASMGATRLAWTVLDRTPAARREIAAEVARFAASDQLCYFADGPAPLVRRQEERWGPVIDWAERSLGLTFHRAQGIVHQPQPPETLARCQALAAESDDFTLTGLAFGAALFGSAILAFALQRGELTAEAAFDLSRLDEAFQEERWGVDAEAAERADAMARDAVMLERWFTALEH
ncbi:MAG: ATP12 family chaperone protein [Caulobacterales bacterium]